MFKDVSKLYTLHQVELEVQGLIYFFTTLRQTSG